MTDGLRSGWTCIVHSIAGKLSPGIIAGTALCLCLAAFWMFLHPYAGVVHDASLYVLGALARLHPQSLSQDLFLKFGSQDQYTLFSPLFAAAIRLFDLEPAAALLTFIGQAGFFGCAFLLARRIMPPALALLAVGLLILMPSGYGAYRIFQYAENFLTARLLAE